MVVFAIRCGMTYEQYWYGEPEAFSAYYAAYVDDEKSRMCDLDTMAWMAGQYNLIAHNIVMSYSFGDKHSKKPEYPDEPMFQTPFLTDAQIAERNARREERKLMEQLARFEAMAARLR